MGKIKSKPIRRAAKELLEKGVAFKDDFEGNKRILGNIMPSKKIRNKMAGHMTRLKKIEKQKD